MNGSEPEAASLEQLRAAIVSRVQHELRTPVAIAAMAFEALRSWPEDPAMEERCKDMLGRALARLQEQVRQLDALSLTEEQVERGPTDLASLLREALIELRPFCAARAVRASLAVSGALRALRLDGELIALAFKAVLDNAVRFNRPGGEVRISVSFQHDRARVEIEDDGIGIPQDQLEWVLSGFHQVEPLLRRREGGLGVGLACARSIVERHGGTIEVRSRFGRGTTVALTLPEAV